MSREKFLKNEWNAYPKVSLEKQGFEFGRIQKINGDVVTISVQSKMSDFVGAKNEVIDPEFGKSIQSSFLCSGDVVAFDTKNRIFYLLSPNLSECNIKLDDSLVGWNNFLDQILRFFLKEEFFQARTPFLVMSPGVDHHIDYLEVRGSRSKRKWTLPTSPEISLKKLLCSGCEKVFEIKSCFRDDLEGPHHKVEFTMLEWYRSYIPLSALVVDLESILSDLLKKNIEIKKVFLADRFYETTGYQLTPETNLKDLQHCAQANDVEFSEDDDWNDVFFRIFMEKIERTLGVDQPEAVFNFPPQQASLAQITKEGWAERFELYWKGVELANAYCEVNDPDENNKRFMSEQSLRKSGGKELSPMDEEFFSILKSGMPPSCGIAMGLDRLYMVVRGDDAI